MKRLALTALLAAAALAACGRSPASPEARRAPAGTARDGGFLGSGNVADTTPRHP